MSTKRSREDGREVETLAMANCLMLLSRVEENSTSRVFNCKTCNRQFQSFQALGGHRTSHKRPKRIVGDLLHQNQLATSRAKTHECPICGLEFSIGQALGGHMRRHRTATSERSRRSHSAPVMKKTSSKKVLWLDLNLTPYENDLVREADASYRTATSEGSRSSHSAPVMKKTSSKKVLWLDLNLTPYENDLVREEDVTPLI